MRSIPDWADAAAHRRLQEADSCEVCDFDFLQVGSFVSRDGQSNQMLGNCGLTVTGTDLSGTITKEVNVFDTANPTAVRSLTRNPTATIACGTRSTHLCITLSTPCQGD
jgi:hypothetical protein